MKTLVSFIAIWLLAASAHAQSGTRNIFTNALPDVDATPYTAADCLGGLVEWRFPKVSSIDSGYITSLEIVNTSATPSSIEGVMYLFEDTPTGGTLTNNSACVIATANASRMIGKISVPSGTFSSASATGANFVDSAMIPINKVTSSTADTGSIWGVFVVSNTPTLSGTQTVRFRLGMSLY